MFVEVSIECYLRRESGATIANWSQKIFDHHGRLVEDRSGWQVPPYDGMPYPGGQEFVLYGLDGYPYGLLA